MISNRRWVWKVKSQSKYTTKWVDTQNYIFVCLKDHNGNILVQIVIKKIGIFPLIANFIIQTLTQSKKNCMFKAIKPWEWTFLFFYQMCTILFELERILTLMIDYKGKRTWIDENCFNNPFEHLWFKVAFDPENYGFWKCDFNKSCSYICDRGHECIIHMI